MNNAVVLTKHEIRCFEITEKWGKSPSHPVEAKSTAKTELQCTNFGFS